MRSHLTARRPHRTVVAAIGVVAAFALAIAGPSPAAGASAGQRLWVSRYAQAGEDTVRAMTMSPDGSRVYVAGDSYRPETQSDYATVAYDAATGTKLWARRYDGQANGYDSPRAVAASPDGSTVFVTGSGQSLQTGNDIATIAYDAATGAQTWISRYDGPKSSHDYAYALAVSPDGSRLYVAGNSGFSGAFRYVIVAYEAATGAKVWTGRDRGPVGSDSYPTGIALSPDGTRVFVTGYRYGPEGTDYATVAFDTATGAKIWLRRYDGPAKSYDDAHALAVSPDGSMVFVTGSSGGVETGPDFATVAYDSVTGAKVWVRRYTGPRTSAIDEAEAVGIGPDGARVYVTGRSTGPNAAWDFATLAYDAATGAKVWLRRYDGPDGAGDEAYALAITADGSRLFVAGTSFSLATGYDYATVAYDAVAGAQVWVGRYNGPANGDDLAAAVAASPDGSRVFVAGSSTGTGTGFDFATVAYQAK